jgi:hypothetical protein
MAGRQDFLLARKMEDLRGEVFELAALLETPRAEVSAGEASRAFCGIGYLVPPSQRMVAAKSAQVHCDTMGDVERVRSRFLSLRQPAHGRVFSGRIRR